MCGIAGFMGDFGREVLGAMNKRISHRGPDGVGEWHDPQSGIGFTHCRLAIIDPTLRGAQPMWDVTGRVVITFNGEIYNYRQLKRELEGDGFKFRSDCDTEVILNLYLRDGPSCLRRLNGIFAFALWDAIRKETLIARDGLGVKPLYYANVEQGLLFASELKALLVVKNLEKTLDIDAIGSYLTFLYAPSPLTMFKSVKKLRPGHALTVGGDRRPREWRFYEIPYAQPISEMSEAEAIAQTRYYIEKAVRRQMIADVPVGAFLSGGLDSSSVAAFAQASLGSGQLSCFTIGFEGVPSEEDGAVADLPYARQVASHLGVDLKTIYVNASMGDDLEEMIYQLDEPQADPAALNTLYISRLARENGIKVLLSGAGGDDIFTGYRRHKALEFERYWSWTPELARRAIRSLGAAASKDSALGRRFSKAFQYAHLTGDRRIIGYFQWITDEVLQNLFSNSRPRDPSELMLDGLNSLASDVPALNRMLYLDTKYFLTVL